MWGLDSHGLRTISDQECKEFVEVGAAQWLNQVELSNFELFLIAFPFQAKMKVNPETGKKEKVPHSKKSLRELAKNGALKWGPFPIPVDEMEHSDLMDSNQDFVVLSCGKKQREMILIRKVSK